MSRAALLLLAALSTLLAQPLELAAQPIFLDGRKLGAVEAREIEGELYVPLLPVAQSKSMRVSLNRHTSTASLLGREVPVVLVEGVAYIAQSELFGLFQLEVKPQLARVDLCSPGYHPPAAAEQPDFEVRSLQAAMQGSQLVVLARVTPGTGRVRVLLRRPDGQLYASFVSAQQTLLEEADLLIPTWISGDVSVREGSRVELRDYAFSGGQPTTHFLTVEADTEP